MIRKQPSLRPGLFSPLLRSADAPIRILPITPPCPKQTSVPLSTFDLFYQPRKTMNNILLILLVLLLLGALPTWPYSSGWGYFPAGGLGLILLVIVIVMLTR